LLEPKNAELKEEVGR